MSGKVVSLTDYGAFIELEPGVEGLIHVSEMSWSKRVKHPSKILNVGDSVEAMVLGVDPGARRISLGLKQVESNPWHDLADKYPVGSKIQGKVRNLTEFGAFVEVEDDIDGLIHISDMISGVGDRAVERFRHEKRFTSNRDAAFEVGRRQRVERGKGRRPAVIPPSLDLRSQNPLGHFELAVPIAIRLFAVGRQKVAVARSKVAGEVLDDYRDAV